MWKTLKALTKALARREATLEQFERRMKREDVKTVNVYKFFPPVMEVEVWVLHGEGACGIME